MTTRFSIILIGILLEGCKTLPVTSDGAKPFSYNIKRYRRANANSNPVVLGHITSSDSRDKGKLVSSVLALDGQQKKIYDADRIDEYEISTTPGIHRLLIVTITYYTAEARFRIKPGDSLRIDFQLRTNKTPLY